MAAPILELEGTWDEIVSQMPDFDGQRLHVMVNAVDETVQEDRGVLADEMAARDDSTIDYNALTRLERMITELFANAPAEERAKLPPDLTDNLDHYIYGWPKK